VEDLHGNCRNGKSSFLVAEVDESDGVFAEMCPAMAVVTNIDLEHLDFYRDMDDIRSHFRQFIEHSAQGMGAVVCADCPAAMDVARSTSAPVIAYGIRRGDLTASKALFTPSGSHFEVQWQGRRLGEFWTPLLGKHNVRNVLAAIGVGLKLDIPTGTMALSIAKNHGVDRRLAHRATVNGVAIWDDYGHHPTEIRATLNALRPTVKQRLIMVFQPHRYTRTSFLYRQFGRAIAKADHVIVTSIYAASEKPIEGVDSRLIVEEARKHCRGPAELISEKDFVPDYLARIVQPGDTVLFQGAGDIYQLSKRLTTALATPPLPISERNAG
jgi:UDP-N-acetylmuramate--alanine ligase